MNPKKSFLLPLLAIFFISGCAQEEAGGGGQLDYEETKKMVVDILKTDDGKKAIQEVMSDEKLRQQLIMDQAIVTDTVQNTLTSDKGIEFWKKTFEDPKFAETIAKTMQKEHEQIMKNLMNDPEYRGKMIEVMKDPELEKELTTVLKGNEYREHLKQVVSETIESPLYQTKIQELLLKASESKASEAKTDEA
ncbi:spore germination lipoprotein GerD [Niallia endozanthoxylica]|uniref:Spore gernimation protein GerD n=1 Tax=Niallia endozanthoxylica TaxID=2036016 RepID=A0A5J5GUC1_9BACI|nr:spore germination lipoprotein GerD [Niallia endozanthoxylica]KAA9011002.1 spore gernimation protein GerD [Niallia endozanthoxylica]